MELPRASRLASPPHLIRLEAALVLATACCIAATVGPRSADAHGSIRVPSGTEIHAVQVRDGPAPGCARTAVLGANLEAAGMTLAAKNAEVDLLCDPSSERLTAVVTSIEGRLHTFKVVPTAPPERGELKLRTNGLTVISLARAGHGKAGTVALRAARDGTQGGKHSGLLKIASGTGVSVQVNTPVGTRTSREGEPFVATLSGELKDVSGILIAKPGARAYGRVTGILTPVQGSKTSASITLELTQINLTDTDDGALRIQTDPLTLSAEDHGNEVQVTPGSKLDFITHSETVVGR